MKYGWRSLQNSIRETTRDSLILLFDMYDHCELICYVMIVIMYLNKIIKGY